MKLENPRNVMDIKALAEIAAQDALFLHELFLNIKSDNERIAYNSSWVLAHLLEMDKNCEISRFLSILITTAASTINSGIKRNIFKILQLINIPKEFQYDCADLALNALSNKKNDVAVRAFAITILEHLVLNIPELIEEVLFLIEKEKSFATAAFIVRSNRFEKFLTDKNLKH